MDVVLTYGLFMLAGIAAGGTWSMWRGGNTLFAGVLLALTLLAAIAGVLRLLCVVGSAGPVRGAGAARRLGDGGGRVRRVLPAAARSAPGRRRRR
ncbi:hypothetical protein GQ85_22765, partial [Rhodococcus rhodochrous]